METQPGTSASATEARPDIVQRVGLATRRQGGRVIAVVHLSERNIPALCTRTNARAVDRTALEAADANRGVVDASKTANQQAS